jgi:hypothetical protein
MSFQELDRLRSDYIHCNICVRSLEDHKSSVFQGTYRGQADQWFVFNNQTLRKAAPP